MFAKLISGVNWEHVENHKSEEKTIKAPTAR